MSFLTRKADRAMIVIVDKRDGWTVYRNIKPTAKTAQIGQQHFARNPNFFVYRVNVRIRRPA